MAAASLFIINSFSVVEIFFMQIADFLKTHSSSKQTISFFVNSKMASRNWHRPGA